MKFLTEKDIELYCRNVEKILTRINNRVSLKKEYDKESMKQQKKN
jgi:hypothetical protein